MVSLEEEIVVSTEEDTVVLFGGICWASLVENLALIFIWEGHGRSLHKFGW